MTTETTYIDFFAFTNKAATFIEKNKDTKLSSHLKSIIGDAEMKEEGVSAKHVKAYNKKLDKINLLNCSVDKNKNIIRDASGHLSFTVEATLKVEDEIEELNNQVISVELEEFVTDEALTPSEEKMFKEFLITKK